MTLMGCRSFLKILLLQSALISSLRSQEVDKQVRQANTPALKTHGFDADGSAAKTVVLDMVARDKGGKPISNLQKKDFVLLDNKRQISPEELNVSESSIGVQEAQMIFVIDALNSSLTEFTKSEDAVEAYLREQTGHLKMPTTILVVSDSEPDTTSRPQTANSDTANMDMHHRELFVHRIPASVDGSVLIQSLKEYKTGLNRIFDSQGSLGQGERVRLSLEAMSFIANAQSSIAGPKLVIWMSPGWPFLARSNAKSSEQLFDSVIYFSNLLRTARIIVYAISLEGVTAKNTSSSMADFYMGSQPASVKALGHAPEIPMELGYNYYAEFLKGVRNAKQSNPNDLALQVLAYQSGGLVLQNNNDLVNMISQCAADGTALYNLSYTPATNGGSDRYHEIDVTLTPSSQRIRTRTGIYVK